MSTLAELHERWSRDADYREAYEQLGPEYEVARALIEARTRAGLTQAELAARMKTTQSAVARLESGRIPPSTRTLGEGRASNGDSAADPVRQHPVISPRDDRLIGRWVGSRRRVGADARHHRHGAATRINSTRPNPDYAISLLFAMPHREKT